MNKSLIDSIKHVNGILGKFKATQSVPPEAFDEHLLKSIEDVTKLVLSLETGFRKVSNKDLFRAIYELSSVVMSSLPIPVVDNKILNKPSIMRALGKWSNENLHSDFIAALLNPDRSGPGAFRLFYELATLSKEEPPSIDPDSIWQSVYREVRLDEIDRTLEFDEKGARRIDIIALRSDSILVIENKVFTWESEGQTVDYAEVVSNAYCNAIPEERQYFIMLSPDGKPGAAKRFGGVSYYQFLILLNNIIECGENINNDLFVIYHNELMNTILRRQIETYTYSKQFFKGGEYEF